MTLDTPAGVQNGNGDSGFAKTGQPEEEVCNPEPSSRVEVSAEGVRLVHILLAALLPSVIFIGHAWIFGAWIMDDAGISFAYARNLAEGYGFVSQPGVEPLEGISNIAWVVVLAPLFRFGLFFIPATPKIVSVALIVAAFAILLKALSTIHPRYRLVGGLALSFLACNTAFTSWAVSGLENPLLVFLISVSLLQILASFQPDIRGRWKAPWAMALTVAAIAMTRPDGIVFAAAYPLSVIAVSRLTWVEKRTLDLRSLLVYFASLSVFIGGFLLFRYLYFHDLFPNPYYVKGGPEPDDYRDLLLLMPYAISKMSYLLPAAGGRGGGLFMGMVLAGVPFLAGRRKLHTSRVVFLVFLGLSCAAYVLLPEDWMGEFRFATVFFVFYSLTGFLVGSDIVEEIITRNSRRTIVVIAALVPFVAFAVDDFARRTIERSNSPPVAFSGVLDTYAGRYNRYSDLLEDTSHSVLIPDMGGMLFASKMRVYDLAGLCDRKIGRTLRSDKEAFHDYVFEEIKPTFIDTHGMWTLLADFEVDPRFSRDYVPIVIYKDYSMSDDGEPPIRSGSYVRRDSVSPQELVQLRSAW